MSLEDRGPRGDRPDGRQLDEAGLVERLIQAAGPGPDIPADGEGRVSDAIRPVWRAGVAERRRRQSWLWTGGLAAAAALLLAALYLGTSREPKTASSAGTMTLAAVEGRLEVTPPGSTVAILGSGEIGVEVPPGSFVRTRSGGRAAIALPQGGSLRLDHGTVARIDSSVSVSLDDGAVYLSSAGGTASGVEVRTALGTVREIGTQFEVRRRGDRLDVMVRDGLVSLDRNGEAYRITHGVSLRIDADGSVTTGTVSSHDEAWGWIQEVAPVFEIEGRTVLAFLDWYTGETGIGVRFADPGIERLAAETILHGSIEGVPVATAPEVLLPSCRLDLTREPGSILVRRLELGPPGSPTTPPGG